MINGKLRRRAPDFEFKLALQTLRGERTRADIAHEHGISQSLRCQQWIGGSHYGRAAMDC